MASFDRLLIEQTRARGERFLRYEQQRRACPVAELDRRLSAHLNLYVPRRLAELVARSLTHKWQT